MTKLDGPHKESTKPQDSANHFLQSGRYRASLFGAAIMLTVLLGIYGCTKESSKPAAAPTAQTVASPAINPDPPLTASSTPAQPAIRKRRVQRRDPLATYSNPAYGISLRYPKNYVLREGDQARLTWPGSRPVQTDFVKPGGVTLAAIETPGDIRLKNDHKNAFVTVSVNSSLTDSDCARFASPDPSLPGIDPPSKVKLGVLEFNEMQGLNGQDAKQTDARYYHVFKNGACYEFALGLGTVSDGAANGKTAVNNQDAFRKLEKILSTARIDSVTLRPPQIPADSRTNPEHTAPPPVPLAKSEQI